MELLPTIKVKHKEFKYEMVINESDYDPKVHEKIGEKAASKKAVEKAPEKPEGDEKPENTEEELKKLMEGK